MSKSCWRESKTSILTTNIPQNGQRRLIIIREEFSSEKGSSKRRILNSLVIATIVGLVKFISFAECQTEKPSRENGWCTQCQPTPYIVTAARYFLTPTLQSLLLLKVRNDWAHLSQILDRHEKSLNHIKAFDNWKELEIRLKTSTTIDVANKRIYDELVLYWRNVLRRNFSVVRFLGIQNLAFQGNTEELNTPGNGNFLKTFEFLSEFDEITKKHIRRSMSHSNSSTCHYLGKNHQSFLKYDQKWNCSKTTYWQILLHHCRLYSRHQPIRANEYHFAIR